MPSKVGIKEAKEIKPSLKLPLNKKDMGVIAFVSIFSLKEKKEREDKQEKKFKSLIILSGITTTLLCFQKLLKKVYHMQLPFST